MTLFLPRAHDAIPSENDGVVEYPVNLSRLSARLSQMTDEKLFRFGMSNRHMCSLEANVGNAPLDAHVVQLREARAEWKRRNLNSAIADSF